MPFAESDGRVNPERLRAYLMSIPPVPMGAEMPGWRADPTDLLALAEVASAFGFKEHALEFYRFALSALERNPAAIAADTNMSGAYYLFAKTLVELRRPGEAEDPLRAASRLSPRDASIWRLLGLSQAINGSLSGAAASLEQALRLEGVDRRQSPEFYQAVRKTLASVREELAQANEQPRANTGPAPSIDGLDAARRYLAERGVSFDGRRVVVPCRKPTWREPQACEVCKVERDAETYTVLVENLPYFFGEQWQAESGGKPVMWEGGSISDVVRLIEERVIARMVDGVLPVA